MQIEKQNLDILINKASVKILLCVIENSGIDASGITKKTKIPIASSYRILNSLVKSGLLDITTYKIKDKCGGNAAQYNSKVKQFQILIN